MFSYVCYAGRLPCCDFSLKSIAFNGGKNRNMATRNNVHLAFYHLLTEIHSQNAVMVNMLLPRYAKANDVTLEDAKATFQKDFLRRKDEIQSHIHVHFGRIRQLSFS